MNPLLFSFVRSSNEKTLSLRFGYSKWVAPVADKFKRRLNFPSFRNKYGRERNGLSFAPLGGISVSASNQGASE